MKFLKYLGRGLNLLFTSINLVIGLIIGAIFGLIATFFILGNIDGYSFSGQSAWHLLPGTILGALAGIKGWPLMLGLFLVGEADVSDASVFEATDFDTDGGDVPDGESEVSAQSAADSKDSPGAW